MHQNVTINEAGTCTTNSKKQRNTIEKKTIKFANFHCQTNCPTERLTCPLQQQQRIQTEQCRTFSAHAINTKHESIAFALTMICSELEIAPESNATAHWYSNGKTKYNLHIAQHAISNVFMAKARTVCRNGARMLQDKRKNYERKVVSKHAGATRHEHSMRTIQLTKSSLLAATMVCSKPEIAPESNATAHWDSNGKTKYDLLLNSQSHSTSWPRHGQSWKQVWP